MYRAKHFAEKKNRKAKNVILAIVAMIELLLLSTTMTFSWFEGTTALRITTDNENYSPLKTSKGLNSSYTVGGESSKYSNTAELNEYIEMQANAKFSPVSSYNGEDFYALMDGTNADGTVPDSYDDYLKGVTATDSTLKFRQLSNEEKNSSLVYFQFQVNAEVCDTTFWLKELPTFTVNGEALASDNNPFRIRIDDGTGASSSEEHNLILSDKLTWPSGGHYASGASRNNMLAVKSLNDDCTAVLKEAADHLGNRTIFKVFDYNTTSNNKNGKEVLFTVPKGETKTITIAIWLEALDQSYNTETIPAGATVDVDIKFCSSWDVVDTITYRDYTAENWIDNTANKKLWLVNDTTGYSYEMKYTSKGTTTSTVSKNTWTVDIPRAVQDITFRCEDKEYDDTPPGVWAPAALRTVSGVTQTTFTAFGSTAGIWYDGEVTQIEFRDYTQTHWINLEDSKGDTPKMRVNITYGGEGLDYSMTDSPVADELGKNTWSTYIPSSVNDVVFNRCKRSDESNSTVYNYWNATLRNNETVYYALDEDVPIETTKTTIYLKIPTEYNFLYNNLLPAVSLTSEYNVNYINNTLGGDLSKISQYDYYVGEGENADTWLGDQGRMTKLADGFYSFSFDTVLANGTYVTLWNMPQKNFNNLDNQTRFAPAIQFNSNYNMLTLSNPHELTDGGFIDAYAYEGDWSLYSGGGDDSTVTTNPKEQYGRWGKEELTATGTYNTHFVHTSTTTSVKATFTYNGMIYAVDLTNEGDSKYWKAEKTIPDDATNIKFTDASGNTWTTSNDRSSTKNYYYATSSTDGAWSAKVTGTKQFHFMHLYSTATSMTASYTYNGVTFTYDMTKSSSNSKLWSTPASVPENFTGSVVFKDNSGREWTSTGGNSSGSNYCYAITNTVSVYKDNANYNRVYYKNTLPNNGGYWDTMNYYYWTYGSSAPMDWPGYGTTAHVDGVYYVLIPNTYNRVIFNNGSTQTVDLTIADIRLFTPSGWSDGKVSCSNSDVSY